MRRIFTIDLMPLNPYFHGTTRRSGAPSCGGSSGRRARSRASSAGALLRRSAALRRRASRASLALARHLLRVESVVNATYFAREAARPAHEHSPAETPARESPSTMPRRSACGRSAPRAGTNATDRRCRRSRLADHPVDSDVKVGCETCARSARGLLVDAELVEVVVVSDRGDRRRVLAAGVVPATAHQGRNIRDGRLCFAVLGSARRPPSAREVPTDAAGRRHEQGELLYKLAATDVSASEVTSASSGTRPSFDSRLTVPLDN